MRTISSSSEVSEDWAKGKRRLRFVPSKAPTVNAPEDLFMQRGHRNAWAATRVTTIFLTVARGDTNTMNLFNR
ncbi:hypothetical protein A0H81_03420 [Grifola frondosa]|uniref:Uncharacterized protein n=1 Tax=Grifola frondosa TaxID=5627 RepID=A0A1C7MJ76_GRIFR|nr:hypothetical protein A0H81_03420 [Grifola frondosa]